MRRLFLFALLLIWGEAAWCQTPVINSVTPIATYPGNKVLITGSGFSSNMAQLRVSFDHVVGIITSSSAFAIEVTLPPQARLSNVEVLNTVSGLSGKSSLKMIPTFGGGDFDPSAIVAPVSLGATREIFDVCSCDFDGDGKPDLIGSFGGPVTVASPSFDLPIHRNTSSLGAISFAATSLSMAIQTANVACGDLDGDGKPDLVASRGGSTRNEIFVFRNTSTAGSITFAAMSQRVLDASHLAFRIAIRDLNLDGRPELIVTNHFTSPGNELDVLVNQSTLGSIAFAPTVLKLTISGASTSYGLDVQDIDGDGKPDILVNQFAAGNIYVLRNTSAGTVSFAPSQQITLPENLIELTTADFNEDGRLDIAVSSFNDRAVILLNQSTPGAVSFGSAINVATGADPWGIAGSDVDGDGDIDVVVGNQGAGAVDLTIVKSNGVNNALAFTPIPVSTGKRSRNVRVGDYDGDGKADFVYTTGAGNSIDIIRNRNCYVPAILNTTPLTICTAQTIRLNAAPGLGVTNYDWKESGGTVASGANAFFDVTTAGNYTVTATSEGGGCIKLSNAIVINSGLGTLPADPVISSNSPLCSIPGQNLFLNGPTVAGVTYIWTGPNGFTSSVEDPLLLNVTTANAGIYSLQLSNGTCFSNVSTTRVDIADLANFSVGTSLPSNTLCQGSNLTLTVNSQSGYTYQWIKNSVDIGAQTGTSLLVTQEGAYTVRVTNTLLSCSITTTPATNVIVLTTPVAGFSVNATGCENEVLTFTDQSTKDSRATAVYVWDFGDAGTSAVASPTHAYTTASTFNPALTLSYSGITGCTSNISKSTVISPSPVVAITPASASLSSGESVQLTAAGAATYAWSPPDGLSSTTIDNPIAAPIVTTTYTVVGTLNGCTGTATVTVDVVPVSPSTIDVPNVFTPNGDGANDQWIVRTTEGACVVSVFDPAGRKVFEEQGSPVIWDGNYSGSFAPQGTYFYVISCPSGGSISGHFLLAR